MCESGVALVTLPCAASARAVRRRCRKQPRITPGMDTATLSDHEFNTSRALRRAVAAEQYNAIPAQKWIRQREVTRRKLQRMLSILSTSHLHGAFQC